MTLHDETSERPSLFNRLFAMGDPVEARGSAREQNFALRGALREHGGHTRTRGESRRDGPLLYALVSFQLVLSALLATLYDAWFAALILAVHVVLCGMWAFALRSRNGAISGLERRAQRAEESALAKSALLATVSHEMRSPLNGILGMSSMLSRTPLDARQQEQVEMVHGCASNLLVMVNDVLDFARLEAGRLPVEPAPFEPRAAVDEVLAINGPRAQEKGIELFAVVHRDVPASVVGDHTRIRQALTNLVANAVKFTAVGEVEVRVSLRGTGWLRFSVSDTGIGIEPTARTRLFKPFSQADSGISKDYGGSGLGLAISRRLVLAMGGSIDFESTPGLGSRFFFDLPLERAGAHERAESRLQTPGVLLVIPHGGTREGLVEVCEWLGVQSRCADHVSSLEHPFDVAIVDGGLPAAQLEELASHPNRARILVIARTTANLPSWPRTWLSWPVRQTGVSSALRVLLRFEALGSSREEHRAESESKLPLFAPGTRVLIVEDTPVNHIVADALLCELGLSARVAPDGEQALSMLRLESFELVLMDCQLPTLSGLETTRQLRSELGPNQHTPVVALTAHAVDGDEAACREAGMDDYLEKPIRRSELIRVLAHWLPARCKVQARESIEALLARERSSDERLLQTGQEPISDLVELEEFLRDFERHVGPVEVQRLAATYRDSIPDTASSLARAALERGDEPDRSALAKHAHALRGAARSMGLRALAARLEELERVSGSADTACLRTLTSDVETRMLAVRDALLADGPVKLPNREAVG